MQVWQAIIITPFPLTHIKTPPIGRFISRCMIIWYIYLLTSANCIIRIEQGLRVCIQGAGLTVWGLNKYIPPVGNVITEKLGRWEVLARLHRRGLWAGMFDTTGKRRFSSPNICALILAIQRKAKHHTVQRTRKIWWQCLCQQAGMSDCQHQGKAIPGNSQANWRTRLQYLWSWPGEGRCDVWFSNCWVKRHTGGVLGSSMVWTHRSDKQGYVMTDQGLLPGL